MSDSQIKKIIAGIPEKEIRALLERIAIKQVEVRNELVATYSSTISQRDLDVFKGEIDGVVEKYVDRYGYISYGHTFDFSCEMNKVLRRQTSAMLSKKKHAEVFELTQHVFKLLENLPIDDSNGTIGELSELCCEIWRSMLQDCPVSVKAEMFQWFVDYALVENNGYAEYLKEYTDGMMMGNFTEEEFLKSKLEVLDRRIAAAGVTQSADKGRGGLCYEMRNNVMMRLQVMKELHASPDEIQTYRRKFHHIAEVRQDEIKELLENKEFDKAIALLKESRTLDRAYSGLVSRYTVQLIELYRKCNRTNLFKKELWTHLFSFDAGLKDVLQYKNACTEEEWLKQRAELLQSGKIDYDLKLELMKSEGLYAELMASVKRCSHVHVLDSYEKCLKKHYPDTVRDIYVEYVKEQANYAGGRGHYMDLVRYLKKILTYPGGEEILRPLVGEWKKIYTRRRAMMEELSRAGF